MVWGSKQAEEQDRYNHPVAPGEENSVLDTSLDEVYFVQAGVAGGREAENTDLGHPAHRLSPWRVSWSRRRESELVWGMHAVVTGPGAGLGVWAGWAPQRGAEGPAVCGCPACLCTHVRVHFCVRA